MTRYYSEEQYYEETESRCATEAEADYEYAYNVGMDNPEQAWILSDRDVWYANPHYTGPRVRHPLDESEPYDTVEEARDYRDARRVWVDDDIPF